MRATNRVEIITSKMYANEVAKYPNAKILDKSKIAPILHVKKIRIDCIVFLKKTEEFAGIVIIINDKFKDFYSEFTNFLSIKSLKDKILLLDESPESKLVLRRIINAYKINVPSEIIAKFSVHKEDDGEILLQIIAADFTELTINSKMISVLADMTYKELSAFKLEEFGFDVSWPAKDIHLNLESFKMIADKKFMKARIEKIEKEKKQFGALIKKYRENHSRFSQKDFGNLNERQIRKYENGESYPSYESLQTISSAYGMTVNEYLNALSADD